MLDSYREYKSRYLINLHVKLNKVGMPSFPGLREFSAICPLNCTELSPTHLLPPLWMIPKLQLY